MDELSRDVIVPCVSYAFFYKLQVVGTKAFDCEEKGWADHFGGGDSEGNGLGGPHGLLREYLVVDLAQTVYEEGGWQAVAG